jgi:sensor histidine kinase YesM
LILKLKHLYILFLLYTSLCIAQKPYYININKNFGLPSNTVYNITQDHEGFIWLTTNDGLVRYDGNEFQAYSNENQTSLAGSALMIDYKNRVWYQNFDGYLYYASDNNLHPLNQTKPTDYFPQGITSKYLFITTNHEIIVYDIFTLKLVKKIKHKNSNIVNTTFDKNKFYIIAEKKLFSISNDLELREVSSFPKIREFWYMSPTKKGVWMVTRNNQTKKLYCLNQNKLIAYADLNISDEILSFKVVDDKIWLLTSNGCFFYQLIKGKIVLKGHFFEGKKISSMLFDRDGNYWFTSLLDGVFLIPDLDRTIKLIPNYNPFRMLPDGQNYLFGTKNHQIIKTDLDFNYIETISEGITNSDVYYLFKDSINGNLFYSSNGTNLISKNKQNTNLSFAIKEFVKLDEKYYAFAASGVIGLYLNPAAPSNFSSHWDEIFRENKEPLNDQIAVLKKNIRAKSIIYFDKSKTLYVATNQGLLKFKEKRFIILKKKKKHLYIQKLIPRENSFLALSSIGNLYEINFNDKISLINQNLGFEDKNIKNIKLTRQHICVYNSRILKIFRLKQALKKAFIADINLANFDVYDIDINKTAIILITNQGLVSLPIKKNNLFQKIPPLKINYIRYKNQYFTKNNIHLPANQNNVELHFSILSYGKVLQNKLLYRVNNEDWKPIETNERTLKFASLAPGSYRIEFTWDHLKEFVYPQNFSFTIDTPFYKQYWFLILCLSLVVISVTLYYRWQVAILKKKNRLLTEKMILEKNLSKSILKSIKSQMNPHFFYNALNTIQSYIFLNDKRNASNYLSKFSKLTRMILEMSEKETIPLSEELKSLTLYLELEKMRFDDDAFEFNLNVSNELDLDLCRIPSMLIQPYVENAIKHGLLHKEGNKKLTISFSKKESFLIVEIIDNGIGRKRAAELNKIKEEKHQSFSSNANAKRLEILNEGLHIQVGLEILDFYEGTYPSGTYVKLTIPIQ